MKNKQDILKLAESKNDKKILFLLSWARFLSYDEIIKYDQLEAYDAEYNKGKIKSKKDWDKLVIPYNEDNIKKAMCIALNKAVTYYNTHVDENINMNLVYCDDILKWLNMIDDYSFDSLKINNDNEIKTFYNEVTKKYKYDIAL